MKNKKELTKLALAGLLLASQTSAEAAAIQEVRSCEMLLAVAGCPNGCPGKTSSNQPQSNNNSQSNTTPPSNPQSSNPSSPNSTPSTQLADAGGDLATPRSSQAGAYGIPNYPASSVGGYYGGSLPPGSYTNAPNGASMGGSYGVADSRRGNSTEAGSWGGAVPPDLGRWRVQEYNQSSYNTNRNFETNPDYQGRYIDSSYYSENVAPYGAPGTSNYGTYAGNKGYQYGYGYEGVTTSGIMTEAQLRALLSGEGWSLYQRLDPEGKALALQLASQANYSNKDLAVREAFIRMQERHSYIKNR